jgi:hypothetical protein
VLPVDADNGGFNGLRYIQIVSFDGGHAGFLGESHDRRTGVISQP